jgi:hypothetical protein
MAKNETTNLRTHKPMKIMWTKCLTSKTSVRYQNKYYICHMIRKGLFKSWNVSWKTVPHYLWFLKIQWCSYVRTPAGWVWLTFLVSWFEKNLLIPGFLNSWSHTRHNRIQRKFCNSLRIIFQDTYFVNKAKLRLISYKL